MRTIVTLGAVAALCGALALVPGCSKASAEELLIGKWTLDIEAMKQTPEFKNASPQERQFAEMLLSGMQLDVTFTATNVRMDANMMGMQESETKPYTIKSAKGSTLVLSTTDDDGKPQDVTVIVGGKTLTLQSDGENIVLKRK